MKISDLDTPALLVDLDRVERNIRRWQTFCEQAGVTNRPHVKTHKVPELAALQLRSGAIGITCQKLTEAEAMAAGGATDILVAYNVVGEAKLQRLVRMLGETRLSVVADSEEVAVGLAAAARAADRLLPVFVEVATGLNRCGVPNAGAAVSLASFIARQRGLSFAGLLSYPSDSLSQEIFSAARDVLTRQGLAPFTLSGGGTPGMWRLAQHQPLTEYRAGTYIYNDRLIEREKAASFGDCALTVLATVVSQTSGAWAVVDGGTKTFSSDQYGLPGFGVGLDDPTLLLERCTEEHGMLKQGGEKPRISVGSRVRLIPNHACAVSNLHDTVYAVRGDTVVDRWAVAARGKLQ